MTKIRIATKAVAAALLFSAVAVTLIQADNGKNNSTEVRLRSRLVGAAIVGTVPEGNGDFRSRPDRSRTNLSVEVEHVNLPANTVLTVSIKLPNAAAATTVGTITLSALHEGELELDSRDGDAIPAVVTGTTVTVSNGATPILTGVF